MKHRKALFFSSFFEFQWPPIKVKKASKVNLFFSIAECNGLSFQTLSGFFKHMSSLMLINLFFKWFNFSLVSKSQVATANSVSTKQHKFLLWMLEMQPLPNTGKSRLFKYNFFISGYLLLEMFNGCCSFVYSEHEMDRWGQILNFLT